MANNKVKFEEKYLPCVLTRLADDNPQTNIDDLSRGVPLKNIKQEIINNIDQMLNSRSRPSDKDLMYDNQLTTSVLAYGLPDFCGKSFNQDTITQIVNRIKKQIKTFEPRILPDSIQINVLKNLPNQNKCTFAMEIRARFAVKEISDEFICVSSLDLESGLTVTKEGSE